MCVIKVSELSVATNVERGLVFIKIRSNPHTRQEIVELANIFWAHIDPVDMDCLMVEIN